MADIVHPIIADRFSDHLEVFGKMMDHLEDIQEVAMRCKMAIKYYSVAMAVPLQMHSI